MANKINPQLDRLEQTTHKILEVLHSVKTELTEFKSEMYEFKSETEEKFEFLIENAATKIELGQAVAKLEAKMATKEDLARAIAPLATKEDLLHFTDRFDAKFADLKHEIIQGIRAADKKFLKFAL